MPDSPGRRAAGRTHVAADNISQYLTSSYEVQTLAVYKTCVLRDSPWDPALVSREFCEPAHLSLQHMQLAGLFLLKLMGTASSAWPNDFRTLRSSSLTGEEAKDNLLKHEGVGGLVSLLHKGLGNTQVLQTSPPTARRNCQWEISLGPSEYL